MHAERQAVVGRLAAGRVVISRVQLSLGDTAAERRSEFPTRGALPRVWRAQCSVCGACEFYWGACQGNAE